MAKKRTVSRKRRTVSPKKRATPKAPRAISDASSKGDLLRFRCSAEQRAAIIAAATRDGRDVSSWLRYVALRAARADDVQKHADIA